MLLRNHVVDLDHRGWSLYHPVYCGNITTDCPVTKVCHALHEAPALGRFECDIRQADGLPPELVLGAKQNAMMPVVTTRKTSHVYVTGTRPGI